MSIQTINFWSGNRSKARQTYESKILEAVLEATKHEYPKYTLKENSTDYPGHHEYKVFTEKNADLLVTVAGNKKFENIHKIVVNLPIAKNLLGYRLLIIRKSDEHLFTKINSITELQHLKQGIPESWSDVDVFKHNKFKVVEKGNFEDIFARLSAKEFDYCSFGTNEVIDILNQNAAKYEDLMMEKKVLLFYPFPLVFYVNANKIELAKRIEKGLEQILNNGVLNHIFNTFYANIKKQLHLNERRLITLKNPLVSDKFQDVKPDLKSL
ncbi:transporter substrate-binding domain-containing protein [Psychroflexus salis]|uniref:Solute-binding protein family 3/N-terminal domain-containing protein n=1 Tax=Psychroflexus salis TaxID=1526574 RepID=A0A916ZYY6_9FLAO|nr:transporter substrate-binding domain-containing protein [Psychroflexus salis]GGE19727.1 hypothetical protein GCM10010831_21070 [Psychroflexus salis]